MKQKLYSTLFHRITLLINTPQDQYTLIQQDREPCLSCRLAVLLAYYHSPNQYLVDYMELIATKIQPRKYSTRNTFQSTPDYHSTTYMYHIQQCLISIKESDFYRTYLHWQDNHKQLRNGSVINAYLKCNLHFEDEININFSF